MLIKITDAATKNIGTTAGLKVAKWIFLKDLFYGIMLPSGNDAAHLLAEIIGFVMLSSKKDNLENWEKINFIDLSKENTTNCLVEFVRCMNLKAD